MPRNGSAANWSPYKGANVRGKRIVAYIRVSRMDPSGEKISPQVQLNEIKRHVNGLGGTIVDVIEDLDLSGRSSKKRQVGKIISMVEKNQADGVAVWKISRWGRNHMDSMKNILDLQHAGGYITSATENLNDMDTPMGSFSLTMMLAMAQLQSDQIGETWTNIQTYRIEEKQLPATGGARFGYVYKKSSGASDPGGYTVDPITGPALVRCYEMYVQGKPVGRILDWLENGVQVKTSRGTRWTHGPLLNALDSGFGAGKIVRGNTKTNKNYWKLESRTWIDGAHEAVISNDLWESYLERRRRDVPARVKSAPYRLAGLIYCAGCGRRMVLNHRAIKSGGQYLLDAEGNRVKKQIVRCYLLSKTVQTTECPSPATMHMDRVEEVVMAWINANRQLDEHGAETARRAQEAESVLIDIKKLEADKAKAENRLAAYARQLADQELSPRAYSIVEKSELAELDDIERRIKEQKRRQRVNTVPRVDAMEGLFMGWDKLEPEQFNEGLRQVVSKIYIGRADAPGALARTRSIGGAVRVRIVSQWEDDPYAPAEEALTS